MANDVYLWRSANYLYGHPTPCETGSGNVDIGRTPIFPFLYFLGLFSSQYEVSLRLLQFKNSLSLNFILFISLCVLSGLSLQEEVLVRLWRFIYSLGPGAGLKCLLNFINGNTQQLPPPLASLLTLFCECTCQLIPYVVLCFSTLFEANSKQTNLVHQQMHRNEFHSFWWLFCQT